MGIMLTLGVVLVMAGFWALKKIEAKRHKPEGIVDEKIVVHYIQTGEVRVRRCMHTGVDPRIEEQG